MLFTAEKIETKDIERINNFFAEYEREADSLEETEKTAVSKYITSLATGCYAKSVEEIANTKVDNRVVRKRNLQQVMQESFFYGANRFGNNFIA